MDQGHKLVFKSFLTSPTTVSIRESQITEALTEYLSKRVFYCIMEVQGSCLRLLEKIMFHKQIMQMIAEEGPSSFIRLS